MASGIYYFNQADLENALSVSSVNSAYGDDHSGVPSVTGIAACIAYGTAQCDSFLRNVHPNTLPSSEDEVPDELRFAAVEFGVAYTMRRRPDVVRAILGDALTWKDFMDSAIAQIQRYAASIQRMPPDMGKPANVGASSGQDDPAAARRVQCGLPARYWDDRGDY